MSVRKILINYKEKVCWGKIVKEKEKDSYLRRCRGNTVKEIRRISNTGFDLECKNYNLRKGDAGGG
jgi:hypothetical protein